MHRNRISVSAKQPRSTNPSPTDDFARDEGKGIVLQYGVVLVFLGPFLCSGGENFSVGLVLDSDLCGVFLLIYFIVCANP